MQTVFTNMKVWRPDEDTGKLVEILFELSDQGQTERMFRVKDIVSGEELTAFEDELF
jgi:hypothetical protein